MMNAGKYRIQYFLPPEPSAEWVKKDHIEKAPLWCSVDLRDGNQSLVVPMNLEQKLEFFNVLLKIGFKEIEVGFPAASETEFTFIRTLIEQDLIPEGVTIQVLTQAREHIIKRTFDSLKGLKSPAIVHVFSPVSKVQREQVFRMSKDEVRHVAENGARMVKELGDASGLDLRYEYSAESFSAAEPEYVLDVAGSVLDIWRPTNDRKALINLPGTVELAMPHVYASQVEYIHKNLPGRENVVLSLHPHNDRGTGEAAAELGLLAGADRIEGTLFGNGERAGNVDLITLAMNLYMHGVDPELNFEEMVDITEKYENLTGMKVDERRPYTGALSFAAFSGSHQDAISKGVRYWRDSKDGIWRVPYLPIDPRDIGRSSDADVIRINSQSGKGGVGFVLEQKFGIRIPAKMREAFGYAVKEESDYLGKELTPDEIYEVFKKRYINIDNPCKVWRVRFRQHNGIVAEVTTQFEDRRNVVLAAGSGRLDAVSNALKKFFHLEYDVVTYEEHALDLSRGQQAAAFVGIRQSADRKEYWGAGIDDDIIRASINALVSAVNNMVSDKD